MAKSNKQINNKNYDGQKSTKGNYSISKIRKRF